MKQKHTLLCLAFLCLSTLAFAADVINAANPADGAVVTPLTFSQRFFATLPIQELEDLFKDQLFIDSLRPTEAHSIPAGVALSWDFKGERGLIHYELLLSEDKKFSAPRKFLPAHRSFNIQNLIPGRTYFWKVRSVKKDGTVTAESKIRSFTVENLVPRVIALPDCWNVRDLGGRMGLGGKMVPYGLIYRSGGLNYNSNDGGKTPGKNTVTAASIREALEVLKIRTELDLRWDNEVAGMTKSPLGPTVQYIHIPTKLYGAIYTPEGMANYAELFRIFTKAENYPIDFHCIAGADRTGTLAFLLEATLGWSLDDIRRDYVYTTHYSPRYFAAIDSLILGMDAYGAKAEPLHVKAERYLLRCGITPEEIETFRKIVLGEDLAASPALEEFRKLAELKEAYSLPADIQVTDGAPLVGTVVLCDKKYPFRPDHWRGSPVKYVGKDAQGRILIQLENSLRDECYAAIQELPAGEYYLTDWTNQRLLLPYDGRMDGKWTDTELAKVALPIPAHAQALYVVTPADQEPPAGQQSQALAKPESSFLLASPLLSVPVIDGDDSDPTWAAVRKTHRLQSISGEELGNPAQVMLGINQKHDALYILARVYDDTPSSTNGPHDSDESWKGDDLEIFLSCEGKQDYFQFIFGRAGCTLDGKNSNVSWNAQGVQSAISEVEDGWILEASIPLAQFNFDGFLELNICSQDNPGNHLQNLIPTGGTFHNREAMKPVFFPKQ